MNKIVSSTERIHVFVTRNVECESTSLMSFDHSGMLLEIYPSCQGKRNKYYDGHLSGATASFLMNKRENFCAILSNILSKSSEPSHPNVLGLNIFK